MSGREGDGDVAGFVGGRFKLGELLGTGGSAAVYAAIDVRSGDEVALKVLHPHLAERPVAREAFLAEARRVGSLRHPNVVSVRDVGFDETGAGPLAWIALDRAAGVSLSEHVGRRGALDAAQAVAVIDGVLQALEAAHREGLVHRDVSPANVMVAPNAAGVLEVSGVRLLDFGLAGAAGTTTLGSDDLLNAEAAGRSGVIGNANYLSPEQARGAPVDARGDVYQAGAVLYFALTARPPFPRASVEETMRAHLHAPPPVPSAAGARVPRDLDRVVVRAMLKDPEDRFPSTAAMRAALLAAGLPSARSAVTTVLGAARSPGGDTGSGGGTVAAAAGADDGHEATKVLGAAMVPPPATPAPSDPFSPPPSQPRRARSRARAVAWTGMVAGAVAASALILVSAAGTGPTTSVDAQPSPAFSVTPTPGSAPSPDPTTVPPDVPLIAIPELVGLTRGEAAGALAAAGLLLGPVAVADSASPAETVLESTPVAGARLRAGSPVALTVASGYNLVPDVAGQGRDAAAALVQAAGFAPSFAYRTASAGTPAGAILGTDPGPGTSAAVGTPITVFEAVAPAPPPTPTPTPTRTATGPPPTPTLTPTPRSEGR